MTSPRPISTSSSPGRRPTRASRPPASRAKQRRRLAVALLVAAGRGERLGTSGPKAFVMLGGRPTLEWALEPLQAPPSVERVVVAVPPAVQHPLGVEGGGC